MQSDPKIFYRRRLPHFQPPGETFHVTFRLAGSLPRAAIIGLQQERDEFKNRMQKTSNSGEQKRLRREWNARYFGHFDAYLNVVSEGPFWLRNPQVADLVSAAIRFRDHGVYELLSFCVMPTHVHMLVMVQRSDASLYRILQSLKSYTARQANLILGRSGAFWHHESYDHVVRDDAELYRTIRYILNNPVSAGLCKHWRDWKWSYVKVGLLEL
jgi:putative transposase